MYHIVCSLCGSSKIASDYKSLTKKDLVCGVCGNSGIEKYKIFDDNGNLVKDLGKRIDESDFGESSATNAPQQLKQNNSSLPQQPPQLNQKQTNDAKFVQKWEYKVVDIDGRLGYRSSRVEKAQTRAEMLNHYGQQGWEFMQEYDSFLYFKRPK